MTYEGRPLVKPVEDRRPADPRPARAAQGAREPRPHAGQDRTGQARRGRGDPGRRTSGSPALDKADPAYEHHLTEALWVHQWHNVVDHRPAQAGAALARAARPRGRHARAVLLARPRARSAGPAEGAGRPTRARASAWRPSGRRASSATPAAVDVALASLKHPTDYYLDYVLNETMRQLEPIWQRRWPRASRSPPTTPPASTT